MGTANCKPSKNVLTEALTKALKPFFVALKIHVMQRLRKWKKKTIRNNRTGYFSKIGRCSIPTIKVPY